MPVMPRRRLLGGNTADRTSPFAGGWPRRRLEQNLAHCALLGCDSIGEGQVGAIREIHRLDTTVHQWDNTDSADTRLCEKYLTAFSDVYNSGRSELFPYHFSIFWGIWPRAQNSRRPINRLSIL
jgi:hypothetical protein